MYQALHKDQIHTEFIIIVETANKEQVQKEKGIICYSV